MIKLGEYQELIVVKKVEFGVYLAQKPEDETRVLLPAKPVSYTHLTLPTNREV